MIEFITKSPLFKHTLEHHVLLFIQNSDLITKISPGFSFYSHLRFFPSNFCKCTITISQILKIQKKAWYDKSFKTHTWHLYLSQRKSFSSSWGRIKYLYSYMCKGYTMGRRHGCTGHIIHYIPQISCWNNFRCDWMDIFILEFFFFYFFTFYPRSYGWALCFHVELFYVFLFVNCTSAIKHESIRFIGFYVFVSLMC